MHPILFEFGPLKIYSYGLLVAAAFLLSTYLLKLEAARQKFDPERIVNLTLWLIISGILGARVLYVLQNLPFYLEYPAQTLMLHQGGLSFYGGLILAIAVAVIFLKKQNLGVLRTFDLIVPYLALAQAIGRIGCLLNGCCYGKPTSCYLGIYLGDSVVRYPVQIYSSLSLLLIFIILRMLQAKWTGRVRFTGQIFFSYALLYSAMRFLMEFLRGDNLPVAANLTLHQLISLAMFVSSAIILWRNAKLSSKSLRQR